MATDMITEFTYAESQYENMTLSPENYTNSTITEDVAGKQVVYSSIEEQVITVIFLVIGSLIGLLGQGSVMCTIIATESLHEIHSYIIAMHCIGDLLLLFLVIPPFLVQLLTGSIHMMSCLVSNIITFSFAHAMNFNNGLLAYER